MSPKPAKTTPATRADAVKRLDVAVHYAELAHFKAGDESSAARNAAAGNAVLAGIAAGDAICIVRLGCRSSSSDHGDAAILLKQVDSNLAKSLSVLVGDKPTAHYGHAFIGVGALKSCLRAMDALLDAADRVLKL